MAYASARTPGRTCTAAAMLRLSRGSAYAVMVATWSATLTCTRGAGAPRALVGNANSVAGGRTRYPNGVVVAPLTNTASSSGVASAW